MNIFNQVFFISTILSFKDIKNKHDVYGGRDFMKIFCKSLKEHAIEIIKLLKRKKKKLLTKIKNIENLEIIAIR